jgi:hypothetical protein
MSGRESAVSTPHALQLIRHFLIDVRVSGWLQEGWGGLGRPLVVRSSVHLTVAGARPEVAAGCGLASDRRARERETLVFLKR